MIVIIFFYFLAEDLLFFGARAGPLAGTAAISLRAAGTKMVAQRFRGRAFFSLALGSGEIPAMGARAISAVATLC